MASSKKSLADELNSKGKPKAKRQVVVDVVCWKCGSQGIITAHGQLPRNEDGTIRALCHDCKAFWQGSRTHGHADLPGQRFLCFNPIQKG